MGGTRVSETVPAEVEIPERLPEPIHKRDYEVLVYDLGQGQMLLRGRLEDLRTQGLISGDPEPITIHEMVVDMVVDAATFEILLCKAKMRTHPHSHCPEIEERYDQLERLSIARGFTHKVRELLGGPKGCSHVTMLIQAMAPVAIQAGFSVRMQTAEKMAGVAEITPEVELNIRRMMLEANRGTCHYFADDGPAFAAFERGEEWTPPLWALERMAKLGIDAEEFTKIWRRRPGPGDAG